VPQIETEVEVQGLAARVDDFISAIVAIAAKLGIDPFEPPRVNDPQLVSERHEVGFDRVHGKSGVMGSLARRQISRIDPRQSIREHGAWRDRAMFDRHRRNLGTPVLEPKPARIGCRIDIVRAGLIEVRPDIMPE
jgi:hypothetical protein